MKIKMSFILLCVLAYTLNIPAQVKRAGTRRPATTIKKTSQQTTQPKLIDLGLPSGTKWADRNMGASSSTAYGSYYAYGETTPKQSFSKENYTFKADLTNIAGTEYDAATKKYGKGWSIPTKDQWQELIDNCKQELFLVNKQFYVKYTGANGNSINIPFSSDGITIKGETPEISKRMSEMLLQQFTNNEDLSNMISLFEYNGGTIKLSRSLYRSAVKEFIANIIGMLAIDKSGAKKELVKSINVLSDNTGIERIGLPIRPIFNDKNPATDESTNDGTIELQE